MPGNFRSAFLTRAVQVGMTSCHLFECSLPGRERTRRRQLPLRSGYLGIDRSDDLVIIQITWNEGRTAGQKKALYKAITEGLGKAPGIRPEDVFINLVDVRFENWSVGKGEAQYAS